MESTCRNFFNDVDNKERKISVIRWKKILASKKKRGLGVSSFFYSKSCALVQMDMAVHLSWHSPWIDIIREFDTLSRKGIDLHSHVKKKVGNGEHTSFWDDVWLPESPLKHIYPRLFALECDKHASVAGKFRYSSLIASFRRAPRGGIEEEQLHLLVDRAATVLLSSINDRWVWTLES
ncbi:hypothetical protein Tco_0603961 [Tanacetum coccineum]